jgi:putative transposase
MEDLLLVNLDHTCDVPRPSPTKKAYRFQLRLRPAQEARLRRHAGATRWVWNKAIAEQQRRHAAGEKYAGFGEMCKWLTEWRNDPETAWLADGAASAQQQTIKRLHAAYERFFEAVREQRAIVARGGKKPRLKWGPPHPKKRGQEGGLRSPDVKTIAFDPVNGRAKVPKFGWLRMRQSREVEGQLRNITVTREGDRWYASIQTELSKVAAALDVQPTLGIDLGTANFAGLSDGRLIPALNALKKQQGKLRYAQRCVSRKKEGSANRRKAVEKMARVHQQIARQRSDWLHKLTTDLANHHPVIAIEDLKIRNMTASARRSAAAAGKGVGRKAALNRSILDAAWGEFRRQLEYKCVWRGGEVILVNPAYTSRTCRICGHESAENRKSQALFACVACGHTEHADIHAAQNILAAGHVAWAQVREKSRTSPDACGGTVRPSRKRRQAPAKQEPTEGAGVVA